MEFTIGQLKYEARHKIGLMASRPIWVALFWLLLMTGLGFLVVSLAGYVDYFRNVYNEYAVILSTEYPQLSDQTPYAELYAGLYEALYKAVETAEYPNPGLISRLLTVCVLLMASVLGAGFAGYCQRCAREQQAGVKNLFDGFYQLGKLCVIQGVRFAGAGLGMLLLVFPGVYLWYRWRPAVFVCFDHPEYGPFRCLREAAKIMRGQKLRWLGLDLSFVGWYILEYILSLVTLLPVLELWIRPYSQIARALCYDKRIGWKPEEHKKPEKPGEI